MHMLETSHLNKYNFETAFWLLERDYGGTVDDVWYHPDNLEEIKECGLCSEDGNLFGIVMIESPILPPGAVDVKGKCHGRPSTVRILICDFSEFPTPSRPDAWTIGAKKNYDEHIAAFEAGKRDRPMKLGPRRDGYSGGCCWPSRELATRYLEAQDGKVLGGDKKLRNGAVYGLGLFGRWEESARPGFSGIPEVPIWYLCVDAPILRP